MFMLDATPERKAGASTSQDPPLLYYSLAVLARE